MKKAYLLVFVILVTLPASSATAESYLNGTGDPNDPYLIEDLADFDAFADPCNADIYWASGVHTKLMCDPNLSGKTYTTALIAPDTDNSNYSHDGIPFTGVFDGNGHFISNITIDDGGAGNHYLGLFGYIDNSAEVKNIGVEDVIITGMDNIHYLGGLCGINDGTISNCYANGLVTGGEDSDCLGGLCGYNRYGTISNCYATGSVIGGEYSHWLGGLCGYNGYYNYGTISNCYATSSVSGDIALGGLCGWNRGTISNCYFYLFGGPDNHQGIALDELQLTDAESFVGFDFAGDPNDGTVDYWDITPGYCPKLSWQIDNGPLPPDGPVTTLSGSGYSDDPFQINNLGDFDEFITNSSLNCGYYILTTDIDLTGQTFDTAVINRYFGGYFEGSNRIVCNVTIDTAGAGTDCLGLFRIISGSVSNLGIENVTITGGKFSYSIGGLCGSNEGGTISNCYATGSINGGDYSYPMGGLCGYNYKGTISNCYATCSINGGHDSHDLGGLCGRNSSGKISNCYATFSITGDYDSYDLGGLCGSNSSGTISNCYANGSVSGVDSLGGLCGENYSGTISDCYATGSVTSAGDNVSDGLGGLCGRNSSYSTISNCYANVSVTSGIYSERLGGLCGENYSGTISDCYAIGSVTGDRYSSSLGGMCGTNSTYGTISNCYATGSVTGGYQSDFLGGLCGSNSGTISNCYSIGSVTGGDWLGGLVGYNDGGFYSACFWDIETSGLIYSKGGIGKTTAEMQTQSTFTDYGWDFIGETANGTDNYWRLCCIDGIEYPKLAWQSMIGDIACPDGVNLVDYAFFAFRWLEYDCESSNNCGGADMDKSNTVDISDAVILAEHWLQGTE